MITTRHWAPFQHVFAGYTAFALRRAFHAMWVRGNLPATDAPLLLVVQHVAWWDPLVLFHLSRVRWPPGRFFVMMDEANLARMRFFRWIGAFGVDRASRAGAVASLRYALGVLGGPGARVVLFPQGRQRPMDLRPLGCEPGAAWIAARAGAAVVPIALRYEFLEERCPDLFVEIGAARPAPERRGRAGADDARDPIDAMLTDLADGLRADVHAGRLAGFDRVVRGRGARDPVGLAPPGTER